MGKFSRGSQLSDSGRVAKSEQRKRRLSEKNKVERRKKMKKAAKRLLVVAIIVFGLVLIFNQQMLKLNYSQLDPQYHATVDDYFADNPLSRSKLFFQVEDLNNYVINAHPEIGEITVDVAFIGESTVRIAGREPAFYWRTNDTILIGDKDGFIYAQADDENALQIVKINDQSALAPEFGDKVTSSSTLEYIEEVEQAMQGSKLQPSYFQIPEAPREIHVYIEGKPYYIKLSEDRSVVGQLDELNKAIDFINKSKIQVKQYIDVRTADKAFYR